MEATPVAHNTGEYRGFALAQLRILSDYCKRYNLNIASRRVELSNGVVVTCQVCYNKEDVWVKIPLSVKECKSTDITTSFSFVLCIAEEDPVEWWIITYRAFIIKRVKDEDGVVTGYKAIRAKYLDEVVAPYKVVDGDEVYYTWRDNRDTKYGVVCYGAFNGTPCNNIMLWESSRYMTNIPISATGDIWTVKVGYDGKIYSYVNKVLLSTAHPITNPSGVSGFSVSFDGRTASFVTLFDYASVWSTGINAWSPDGADTAQYSQLQSSRKYILSLVPTKDDDGVITYTTTITEENQDVTVRATGTQVPHLMSNSMPVSRSMTSNYAYSRPVADIFLGPGADVTAVSIDYDVSLSTSVSKFTQYDPDGSKNLYVAYGWRGYHDAIDRAWNMAETVSISCNSTPVITSSFSTSAQIEYRDDLSAIYIYKQNDPQPDTPVSVTTAKSICSSAFLAAQYLAYNYWAESGQLSTTGIWEEDNKNKGFGSYTYATPSVSTFAGTAERIFLAGLGSPVLAFGYGIIASFVLPTDANQLSYSTCLSTVPPQVDVVDQAIGVMNADSSYSDAGYTSPMVRATFRYPVQSAVGCSEVREIYLDASAEAIEDGFEAYYKNMQAFMPDELYPFSLGANTGMYASYTPNAASCYLVGELYQYLDGSATSYQCDEGGSIVASTYRSAFVTSLPVTNETYLLPERYNYYKSSMLTNVIAATTEMSGDAHLTIHKTAAYISVAANWYVVNGFINDVVSRSDLFNYAADSSYVPSRNIVFIETGDKFPITATSYSAKNRATGEIIVNGESDDNIIDKDLYVYNVNTREMFQVDVTEVIAALSSVETSYIESIYPGWTMKIGTTQQ